jgi:N-ethylmaleimide reductase
MAPMTRNRATGNVPNELMAQYCAGVRGLIVTEDVAVAERTGLPRSQEFSAAQIAGWSSSDAVAAGRGCSAVDARGRTRTAELSAGAHAGAVGDRAAGRYYTDAEGMKPNAVPEAMTEADIKAAVAEFAQAARNAVAAGFDGIELHGANGYLLEQFIRPTSNQRSDRYGGSIENRARFVLEVTAAAIAAIGRDKVGIRLSPFGVFNDMPLYPEMEADYAYLARALDALGRCTSTWSTTRRWGRLPVPESMKATFRRAFTRALIYPAATTRRSPKAT